ncbi:class I SAM-dependent methyltransferase [Pedobacter gandavensis]|uniref:class I SAM-dependent methyltransferase n=1 Tax=Pedobacter gandavensis TaxID=2679963 RepID=UPI0029318476|nr:class I SAM-dependent methyltransferase [Pedobacter gandavensis]
MILKQSTETLLFKPNNFKEIYDDLHELHQLYASHTSISAGNMDDTDLLLPSGKAISPTGAAHCLLEIQRTAVFIRGIHKAILKLKQSFPDQQLHILYAGCGPYATLVTPFTTLFSPEEIRFHLLDINEHSIAASKKLYEALNIEDYVAEWICADATQYKFPTEQAIHLVISETMLNALRKEPQVEIMLNLIPQMQEKAIFIPDNITVSAQLLNKRQENDRLTQFDLVPERINLGNVYSIGRANCKIHEQVCIQIPQEVLKEHSLQLLTEITTFEEERLGIYQSSLNMPVAIANAQEYAGRKINFDYHMGEVPGFKYSWLP